MLQFLKLTSIQHPLGTNVAPPTGEGVMVKKGEAVWLCFQRAWGVSGPWESLGILVDGLLPVRGEVIIS